MANICRTEITIVASPEAIEGFVERFEKCHSGKYPNEENTPHIIDEFGAKAELLIDRIGSKWVQIYDDGIYHSRANQCEFSLESAWYPPSDMILEMFRQLEEIDPEVKMYGKYWDEGYKPIGMFEVYYGIIIDVEEELDVDEDMEYFWDEVVEPAFDGLQSRLDKKMKNI